MDNLRWDHFILREKNILLVGESEGNGHPYSWGAIINGYKRDRFICPQYPLIQEYLSKQKWPNEAIDGFRVTHYLANCEKSGISVANSIGATFIHLHDFFPENFIGYFDAILIARDDVGSVREEILKNLCILGVDIYLDKPLALTPEGLERISRLEAYKGQIFSCSALRFSNVVNEIRRDIPTSIAASTPGSWDKYSIHLIEPILSALNFPKFKSSYSTNSRKDYIIDNNISISVEVRGNVSSRDIYFDISNGEYQKRLVFDDTFHAFKRALHHFLHRDYKLDDKYQEKQETIVSWIDA